MTRYGTSHFTSIDSAIRYYASQGSARAEAAAAVGDKLRRGEIHIGRPDPPAGHTTKIDPVEGRYFIESINP